MDDDWKRDILGYVCSRCDAKEWQQDQERRDA
jgi:DNA-directed RNA polymerase subunit RPC12/RpoP